MKPKPYIKTKRATLWIALALAVWIAGAVTPAVFAQMKERPVLPKPAATEIDPNAAQTDVIVVKFREGTGIRLRNDQWAAPLGRSLDEQRLLQRANLDDGQVLRELEAANGLLQSNANLAMARLFSRPEDELDLEKQLGEQNSNEELADLNLYYHLFLDNAAVEDTEALIDQLNALAIVEIAYAQPIYHLAQAPTTPDFTGQQTYFRPAFHATDSPAAYLFSVGLQFVDELDRREVSEALREQFRRPGTALTPPLRVDVEQAESRWRIFDANTDFYVRKEGGTLNVYATSNGLDVQYAWTLAGGKGQNVRVIDIEFDWRDGHEDLPVLFYNSGVRSGSETLGPPPRQDRSHGSAVLGVIAGRENTFGISGMAPQVQGIGISHPNRQVCTPMPCRTVFDVADAVNRAAGQLTAGDVILIEVQVGGPLSGLTCTCNCGQFESVPVEYNQAEYDAIRNATLGPNLLVVVEAAGNGSMDLNDTRYERRFDPSFRDSWAIMVGAGMSGGRAPACFTNSGARVDVQGWGDSVVTAGYGNLFGRAQGLPETRWYTAMFSGTSSGSAIITGAVANVQGVRRTRGLVHLSSIQMRRLLRQTGVAQAAGRPIGPLPNLKEAIALYVDASSAIFSPVGTPDQPYRRLLDALNAAWNNAQIKMRAGTYREVGTFSQPTIWMSTGGTVTIMPMP